MHQAFAQNVVWTVLREAVSHHVSVSLESLSLCHRLLEHDERIVIATRWHMRLDLLDEACKVLILLLVRVQPSYKT